MSAYCKEVKKLEGAFDGLELTHVLRNDNNEANELAKMGSRRNPVPPGVFMQQLHQPSISKEPEKLPGMPGEAEILLVNPDWTTPYLNFLLNDELPKYHVVAERIARRSKRYVVVDGKELYFRSASGILLCCVAEEDGKKLLQEIHSGMCGNHAASRMLVGKAYRQGFYWSTAVSDSDEIIRRCEGCQFFARQIHVLPYHNQMN